MWDNFYFSASPKKPLSPQTSKQRPVDEGPGHREQPPFDKRQMIQNSPRSRSSPALNSRFSLVKNVNKTFLLDDVLKGWVLVSPKNMAKLDPMKTSLSIIRRHNLTKKKNMGKKVFKY
jgi:hypothetical protein